MSTLAITFAACAYEQRHLPLQFLLLSQDEIENLARELVLLEFVDNEPGFAGTLEELTEKCRARYSCQTAWLGLFATLNSFEWVRHFLEQDIDIYPSLVYFRYSGQDEMIKFLVNRPGTSDLVMVELMNTVAKNGKPEMMRWFLDQGVLQKWNPIMLNPFNWAYYAARWDNARVMLESGLITIGQINDFLNYAAECGFVEGVQLALEFGASDKTKALSSIKLQEFFTTLPPHYQQIEQLLR